MAATSPGPGRRTAARVAVARRRRSTDTGRRAKPRGFGPGANAERRRPRRGSGVPMPRAGAAARTRRRSWASPAEASATTGTPPSRQTAWRRTSSSRPGRHEQRDAVARHDPAPRARPRRSTSVRESVAPAERALGPDVGEEAVVRRCASEDLERAGRPLRARRSWPGGAARSPRASADHRAHGLVERDVVAGTRVALARPRRGRGHAGRAGSGR